MGAISETKCSQSSFEQRSIDEYLLWVPGLADLVKDVNQGILLVGLECYMEIDCALVGRGTQAAPVVRGDIPLVFDNHVAPRRRYSEERRRANEERGSKDQEYREPEVAHILMRLLASIDLMSGDHE